MASGAGNLTPWHKWKYLLVLPLVGFNPRKHLGRRLLEKVLGQARVLLDRMGKELEDGELHKALETQAELQQCGKGLTRHDGWKQISREMAGMQGRLRELREWHHWSNDKVRNRLIAEMEVLPAADLHPDALLDRVKSLQTEWKTLEQSEQIPGEKHFASAAWMWRKFSAAGHAAFDTAKPYLEKRSEIQSRQSARAVYGRRRNDHSARPGRKGRRGGYRARFDDCQATLGR